MRKKILIFGHYGVPNWGDEAILAGILSQIDYSRFSVTVVSTDPEFTKKEHGVSSVLPPPFGVRSFFGFGWRKCLKSIKESDYVIFGGGGLWQPRPIKALKLWDWYLRVVQWYGKKVFCLGVSFGNIENIHVSDGMKKRLQKVKYFSVRDSSSVTVLQEQWGVDAIQISQTSDAAFFAAQEEVLDQKENTVLCAMREGDLSIQEETIVMDTLKKQFPNAVFKCLVMQSSQSRDEAFAKRNDMEAVFPQSVADLKNIILSSRFVCSSRLHANIIAATQEIPFCAIACREKVWSLFGRQFAIQQKNIVEKGFAKRFSEMIHKQKASAEEQQKFLRGEKEKLEEFFPEVLR